MEKLNQNQEPTKELNIKAAVATLLFAAFALFSIAYTVKASFTDNVLENLEKNYAGASNLHSKQRENVKMAVNLERSQADQVCNAFKALKAYKESKNIPLKNDSNPCQTVKAPSEGF